MRLGFKLKGILTSVGEGKKMVKFRHWTYLDTSIHIGRLAESIALISFRVDGVGFASLG